MLRRAGQGLSYNSPRTSGWTLESCHQSWRVPWYCQGMSTYHQGLTMPNKADPQQSHFLPEIQRARFERLTIFKVADSELIVLEKGSPDSISLDFAIFLLSVGTTLLVALVTTTIQSDRVLITSIAGTLVGNVFGLLLLISWYRNWSSVSECIEKIRRRLAPEGTASRFRMAKQMSQLEQVSRPKVRGHHARFQARCHPGCQELKGHPKRPPGLLGSVSLPPASLIRNRVSGISGYSHVPLPVLWAVVREEECDNS